MASIADRGVTGDEMKETPAPLNTSVSQWVPSRLHRPSAINDSHLSQLSQGPRPSGLPLWLARSQKTDQRDCPLPLNHRFINRNRPTQVRNMKAHLHDQGLVGRTRGCCFNLTAHASQISNASGSLHLDVIGRHRCVTLCLDARRQPTIAW
jgi:hypothetical protein